MNSPDAETAQIGMSPETEQAASPEDARRTETAALLHRAREGDRTALAEIVDRFMPLVWNVARARSTDREVASDVVQNVWLSFLQHLHEIHTPAALAGWLVTVTRREVIRMHTMRRRHDSVQQKALAERADSAPEVGARIAESEDHGCLRRNLQRLTPRCQELLRIIANADQPNYAAISHALGMPVGSIGPTRGRCLAELRRLLINDPTWSRQ